MIVRQVIDDDPDGALPGGGPRLQYGQQVLIPNTLNHRDGAREPAYADSFVPQLWLEGRPHQLVLNHFSSGRQSCAGIELALFLGKAVLANMLSSWNWSLERPVMDFSRPLPRSFNYFRIRLRRTRVAESQVTPSTRGAGSVALHGGPGG